jgi:hypothetical protein
MVDKNLPVFLVAAAAGALVLASATVAGQTSTSDSSAMKGSNADFVGGGAAGTHKGTSSKASKTSGQ